MALIHQREHDGYHAAEWQDLARIALVALGVALIWFRVVPLFREASCGAEIRPAAAATTSGWRRSAIRRSPASRP